LITALQNSIGWDVSYIKSRLVDAPYWQLRWDADNQMIDQNIYWDGYGTFSNTDVAACFTASSTSAYSGEIFLECNLSYVAGHEEVQNGAWEQINVQPGGGGLPPQTGNAGKFLTTDGTDLIWGSVTTVPSTTPVLLANGWTTDQQTGDITQTITVSGVTADNVIFAAPAPVSTTDYADANVLCTAQAANSLTFKCSTIPTNDISLSVVILG
jgi:hypothetical protein